LIFFEKAAPLRSRFFRRFMLHIPGVGRNIPDFRGGNLDIVGFWKKSTPHFSQKFTPPVNQTV
jgi:hypothetical protein